jgi:hypothetical protein
VRGEARGEMEARGGVAGSNEASWRARASTLSSSMRWDACAKARMTRSKETDVTLTGSGGCPMQEPLTPTRWCEARVGKRPEHSFSWCTKKVISRRGPGAQAACRTVARECSLCCEIQSLDERAKSGTGSRPMKRTSGFAVKAEKRSERLAVPTSTHTAVSNGSPRR